MTLISCRAAAVKGTKGRHRLNRVEESTSHATDWASGPLRWRGRNAATDRSNVRDCLLGDPPNNLLESVRRMSAGSGDAMSSRARLSTKDLGAFYTPESMADILADWVVQTGQERLLEPSVGDGALLRAALACAERRSPDALGLCLVGCDLDEDALAGVRQWLLPKHVLLSGDFLHTQPEEISPVDGIISNPPFTRHHALPKPLRDAIRERFAIRGAAGLWVAFLLHSMRFLTPGGRMAAVVPGAALFATYGRQALTRICAQFEHVEIRQIIDKPLWSSHAEERGAILLARGFLAGSCSLPSATRWSASGIRATEDHGSPVWFRQALLSSRRLGELELFPIRSGHRHRNLLRRDSCGTR